MSLLWSSLILYFVVELFTFLVSMVNNMTLNFLLLSLSLLYLLLLFFVIFILNFYNFNFFLLSFIALFTCVNLIRLFCFSYVFKSFNRQ